ncbi:MAG: hypothetical protein WC307_02980 [Candidatus Nanoarchaeia archaeon]|jgi:hypothetical protein
MDESNLDVLLTRNKSNKQVYDRLVMTGFLEVKEIYDMPQKELFTQIESLEAIADTAVRLKPLSHDSVYYNFNHESIDKLLVKNSIFDGKIILFNEPLKHQYGPDLACELIMLDYKPSTIEPLSDLILSKYESIKGRFKPLTALSAALFLSCRGQFQCPAKLGSYYKLGKSLINKHANELSFNPYQRISNLLVKSGFSLQEGVGKPNILKSMLDELNINNPSLLNNTAACAASLVYYASMIGYRLTLNEAAKQVKAKYTVVKDYHKQIRGALNL